MKTKMVCLLPLISLLLFANTSLAQNSLLSIIEGKDGMASAFTQLPPEQQTIFVPANAMTLLGLDKHTDLNLMRAETDQLGEVHYRYSQMYKGIPVENTMYIMHTKSGVLKCMNGSLVIDFPEYMSAVQPSMLPEEAIQKAIRYVNANLYAWEDAGMEQELKTRRQDSKASYIPAATKTWYSPGGKINPENLRLAYKVDIYAKEPLSRAFYYIDAQTGEMLGKNDQLCFIDATGTANTGYSGTQIIHSDFNGTNYRLRDYTKGSGVITLNGNTRADYTSATTDWNLSGNNKYALDAHYGVAQTYDFYKTSFNRNSIDNNGFQLISYANESSTVDNAYWDGFSMHFGVRSSTGAGVDAIDIAAHELTHGVTQYTSGLEYYGESGAMNESMSDIVGKSVQFWSKPNDVDWRLSNDMGWIIRNMSNPNQLGHPDTYHGTYWHYGGSDNGGVHTNSGVGNFMFYLLATGGSGTNDINNSYTVSGIGLAAANAIIYRSQTVYLTSVSDYADWRTACISAATDLYGAASNETAQVANAFYAVGIGGPGGAPCTGTPTPGTISPSAPAICSNTSTTLTLSGYTTGKNGITFQWKSSPDNITFTNIAGATFTNYSTPALTSSMYYSCVVSCVVGSSATSNVVKVTVTPNAGLYNLTGGGVYCSGGGGVAVGLSGSETGVNYQLKNNGSNTGAPVAGTGSAVSFGNQAAAGVYTAVATVTGNGCTRTMTGTSTVTVNTAPTAAITANGSTVICAGSSVTLISNTGTGFLYQWKKNGNIISGATLSSYPADSAGSFTCVVTNACSSATSNAIAVTVVGSLPPAVISAGGSTDICFGSSATLNANVGSGLTYQWKLNGANLSGATSASYAATATGNYTCVVSNSCGGATSNAIAVTVVGRNTLVLQPNGSTGIDALVANIQHSQNFGSSVEMNALAWSVSGSPANHRGFLKFDLTLIPVNAIIQQSILTLYNNPLASNSGGQHSNYSGSNAGWIQKVTGSWNEQTITWDNQPLTTAINRATIPQSTDPHENYNVDVTSLIQEMVSGPSTNYGMMISLQTEISYRSLIFASSDNIDSTRWPKLSILYTTTSISPSGSTSLCQGDSVALVIDNTNSTYSYQWKLNGNVIPGAILPSYYAKLTGNYLCTVNDSCGNTNSNTVAVTTATPPSAIIEANGSTTICFGKVVSLSASTATGITYQWQKNGILINGATSSVYAADTAGDFRCVLSNNCFSSTSNIITVTLAGGVPNATITASGPINICTGKFVVLFADSSGSGQFYQWLKNNVSIMGATSPNYSANLTGNYRCIVANGCGSDTSNSIMITVAGGGTNLVLQPNGINGIDVEIASTQHSQNLGSSGELNALAWTVNSSLAIQRGLIKFDLSAVPINASITNATLTLSNDPYSGNGGGKHSSLSGSNAAWLQRITEPWFELVATWDNQPLSTNVGQVALPQSINPNQDYDIDVTTSVIDMVANPSTNYGWMVKLQNENYYRALILASSDNIDSTNWPKLVITYTVPYVPAITALNNADICQGDSAALTVVSPGTMHSYQWLINGVIIPGATYSGYPAYSAGNYSCIVADSCGSAFSNSITVTAVPPPNGIITANGSSVCFGGSSVLLSANTGTGLSYQWQLNGKAIINATQSTFTVDTAGNYICIVSNECQAVNSNTISVAVAGGISTMIFRPNANSGTDAMVSSYPLSTDQNFGTANGFNSYAWTSGGTPFIERGFIRFDLSTLPVNATITGATLSLYNSANSLHGGQHSNLSGQNASYLMKVTSAWDENTITWNNQPAVTSVNQVNVPQSTSAIQDYYLDITDFVKDIAADPSTNYGWMIRLQNENYYRGLLFASSDDPDSTKWPRLTVNYSVPLIASINSAEATAFCDGDSVHLEANPSTSGYTYQWIFNNSTIANATATSHFATKGGDYACIITDSCGSATSNIISISVNQNPIQPIIQLNAGKLCALGYDANYRFEWLLNENIFGGDSSCVVVGSNGSYVAIVTDTLTQCKSVSAQFIVTGEKESLTSQAFRVHPNPSKGIFIIDTDILDDDLLIRIYDITGKVIYNRRGNIRMKSQVDLSENAAGIYLIQINHGNQIFSQRIIIE